MSKTLDDHKPQKNEAKPEIKIIPKECDTYWVKIYIAGPIDKATEICQEFVSRGHCVNVSETNYIYKYGREKGVCVEFITYPLYPRTPETLLEEAWTLAYMLLEKMHQGSFTIEAPDKTYTYDRR